MTRFFISHSSKDDAFVRQLRTALADHGQHGWTDSRELRGGDARWTETKRGIEEAAAFAVVVSQHGLQSKRVGKELRHALKVRKQREQRGDGHFPVIPLSLDGTRLGMLEAIFGEEPVYLPVSSGAGGVEAAIDSILTALRLRQPADVPATLQPRAEPLEDLVLELTDLKIEVHEGKRRAVARARLVYQPATLGQPSIHSVKRWRFIEPLGPIEREELRWYLEDYAVWPSGIAGIKDRAGAVEANLVEWGGRLYGAAMPEAGTKKVMAAWARIGDRSGRRFSVQVDAALDEGTPADDALVVKEAATRLLGLPWELLHDGDRFLFQGAKPTRVRRRLPNTESFSIPVVATPIRILLVTARPDDEACSYINHRESALPLVDAMESLPGLVRLHILSPPTLPALSKELKRAFDAGEPYHVVHFDGHGVYDKHVGLGGLCFELPEDEAKLEGRRHATVFTKELGPLLRDHRIPLVFLEACQTAQAEKASESVASELLKVGVASVVAMSHSVLVETARRFVETFYQALAEGKRVGDAMLDGQRRLSENTSRGRVFGTTELRLEDWFVPVLFQEKNDPQLFTKTPAKQTVDDFKFQLARRLGDLPSEPDTRFIGRSRELLALERLLRRERYAVVRGQGGEGKTALAAEFGRWMVRSHQVRRAAFVSVERLEKNIAESVLDKLGAQLVVKEEFSTKVDFHGDLEEATQEIERELCEQRTLLVVDNMESILLPPMIEEATPQALSEDAREELKTLLALCERLMKVGDTRLIFTSREWLPAPFNATRNQRELRHLGREDAVKLVERVLDVEGGDDATATQATREEIEQLVDAVHCHARTLALLAPALRERGVKATRESLVTLMVEMEKQFPGNREQSVFATVELSLRRLTDVNRERARALAMFHGGVNLAVLRVMMKWEVSAVATLAAELVATGLATPNRYNHLTLNPALCPYLRGRMDAAEHETLMGRWIEAMRPYVWFLVRKQKLDTEVAATLTVFELANIFALLDLVAAANEAEATIELTTLLYGLLQPLGRPRLLARVGHVQDAAVRMLGEAWNHVGFEAARTRIQQQFADGRLQEALEGAQQLLQRARASGEQAYVSADYDLAVACFLLARILQLVGRAEEALSLLDEARQRFEATQGEHPSSSARMASVCFAEQGDCLVDLGRLDEAAAAYQESTRLGEVLGASRIVAVGKSQLGNVRLRQGRHAEALQVFSESRERFTQLDEPSSVATTWHLTGMVHHGAGEPDAAEHAYRKSLAITVALGDIAGQAGTLNELGNLYHQVLSRPEEAAAFFRQAVDKNVEIGAVVREGGARNNLAIVLLDLRRLDEARTEIGRAVECKAPFGHAAEPWTSWAILARIEIQAANYDAAAEAKKRAVYSYLAYRRDGGENHSTPGRMAIAVSQALLAGSVSTVSSFLNRLGTEPNADPEAAPFIRALLAVVAGTRDRALADAPDLDYTMAAEILFLIETLDKPPSSSEARPGHE
jgi:tetratricopeptide (TPR) repeat protein